MTQLIHRLCAKAVVADGIEPVRFAILLGSISELLEGKSRYPEQSATFENSLSVCSVDQEDELNDEEVQVKKTPGGVVELDEPKPRMKKLRRRSERLHFKKFKS